MLELFGIKKEYPVGDGKVEALKGIDLKFREKEFVAILGPSGCGKTTLLNIIGGLDHYTKGDLVINGRTTREYKARDWDTYRNHSIGFVFQNYNLIPHQTVLRNVELSLTLAGVSKAERTEAARRALEEVGLGSQLRKKPGQMSGGQMQRVAIARALVNAPEIILADEPTGALDTETSVQIMEILKKAADEHLVVMVTHNAELAETYASRIIRMVDGVIIGDTAPISDAEAEALRKECTEARADEAAGTGETGSGEAVQAETAGTGAAARKAPKGRKKKPSMSLFTAMLLSLNNLLTKKGRTLLTAFAGSIGIIGIALIYSVSTGTNMYIARVQEETLASYPISIEDTHTDLNDLLRSIAGSSDSIHDHENDAVYQRVAMYSMVNMINDLKVEENDLKAFKTYLNGVVSDPDNEYGKHIAGISYSYGTEILIYTKNIEGELIRSETGKLMNSLLSKFWGTDFSQLNPGTSGNTAMTALMTSGRSSSGMWEELLPGTNGETVNNIVKSQYDMLYGEWPTSFDQVVLVLDSNNELSDMVLYALGLKTEKELNDTMEAALAGEELTVSNQKWSYEELCSREYKLLLNSDCFVQEEAGGNYTDLRDTDAGLRYLYNKGVTIRITGIIRPKAGAVSPMLDGAIGYTYKLNEYVISATADSPAAKAQREDPYTDIFTGLPFKDNISKLDAGTKAQAYRTYMLGLDTAGKAAAYRKIITTPTDAQISAMMGTMLEGIDRAQMEEMLIEGIVQQTGMKEADIRAYIGAMSDADLSELVRNLVEEQIRNRFASQAALAIKDKSEEELAAEFDAMNTLLTEEQCALLYETVPEFSDSTYDKNMELLGNVDPDTPVMINIYTSTFAGKDEVQKMIDAYNEGKDELTKINYTDYVGIIMNSVTTIINSISYVLIAFVAISLFVSSIMIGVITLISVQERTKEIGVLRALGASKQDVANMFVVETVIIGFVSGVLGVLVSRLLILPINAIIHRLSGIDSLSAYLPVKAAFALILISMTLTLIAGLIPSGSAARKDPVEALRTE